MSISDDLTALLRSLLATIALVTVSSTDKRTDVISDTAIAAVAATFTAIRTAVFSVFRCRSA